MAAPITRDTLVEALKELLPPLDPEIVTIGVIQNQLAARLGVDMSELKKHRAELKEIVADMLYLCQGGVNKENQGCSDENASDRGDEEEEEPEPVVRKKKPVGKRSRAIRESDDEDGAEKKNREENDSSDAVDDDDSEDDKPKRRKKRAAPTKRQKTAAKPSSAKRKSVGATKLADKQKDSDGIVALKELARVTGLLGPAVYSLLKKADSEEEQEAILRERLREGGVCFSGSYPKKADIVAAKKKKDKERELDGIDTSLIIDGGRPRRGAAQRASYVEKYDEDDDDEELEKGEGQEKTKDADQEEDEDEESEAHADSDASDDSEAEF